MVHPIIVGVFRGTIFFQPFMWEPRGLPLGERGVGWLVRVGSRCSPLKGGSRLRGPSNSCDASFRLHIHLDQLEDEATP